LDQLTLLNCHAEVELIEAFSNARKKRLVKQFNAIDKRSVFQTPGHYNKFIVAASRARIAPRPPVPKHKPKALILSVEAGRPGSTTEQENAVEFFKKCGFDVDLCKNPSSEDMQNALRGFRIQQQDQLMCAVAIMAHGSEGRVTASDHKTIPLRTLFGMLDSERAPHLRQVQKFVFVQACRGGGASLTSKWDAPDPSLEDFTRAENFHWCYATTPGLPANRGRMFKNLKFAASQWPGGKLFDICVKANEFMQKEKLLMQVQHTLTSFPM